jgi:hypothetical protein
MEAQGTNARDLLLMAAAVHGLGPSTDLNYANSAKVIRQALHWAGLLQGAVEECFESYDECPPVTKFYDALVSMTPLSDPVEVLFECQGYWGGPDGPRASAHFTSCRLLSAVGHSRKSCSNAIPAIEMTFISDAAGTA